MFRIQRKSIKNRLICELGVMISVCLFLLSIHPVIVSGESLTVRPVSAASAEITVNAVSAVLMEAETGKVLYEKEADRVVSPASITKIMTLLLIFDAIEEGKIDYDDLVTTSEHAKSMGGSQVFLETGEQQTVETLIKCIVIASGNDASVSMAEYIGGSEEAFVGMMNERAADLGMKNTHFLDCCGLNDTMDHHTSARDVAIMSRELITKYPQIHQYSKIWMENITHVTAAGSKDFTLANTNKLLKQYDWITGLKTGSTSLAKYCLSATAEKEGKKLIAVIMGAPDFKTRFKEAASLLNYGYAVLDIFRDDFGQRDELLHGVSLKGGVKKNLSVRPETEFVYVCEKNENSADIEGRIEIRKNLKAPVKNGEVIGRIVYYIGERPIGNVSLIAAENVRKNRYIDFLKKMWYNYVL